MQLALERFAYMRAKLAQVKMTFQDIEAFEELKSSSRLSNISRLDCSLLADIQVRPFKHVSIVHLINRRIWIAKDVHDGWLSLRI